jgi:inner membrane protein
MPWWGWIIVGVVLFGAEMFGINAQFYLAFLGAAALVVGLIGSLGIALPEWVQWLIFAVLAIVCMVAFRERIYRRLRGADKLVDTPLGIGASIQIPVRLEPDASCRVDYRGSTWTARNVDRQALEAGAAAEVAEVVGLTLHLRRPSQH